MNTKRKLTIIVLLTFICLLNSTAQINSGTITMTQTDWECTSWYDDECEDEAKYYTLNVTPNTPIKINIQTFTYDYIYISTSERNYYSKSEPSIGVQSFTVISPTGTIYIYAYYAWNGKTINPVFSLNYGIDPSYTVTTNPSIIQNDQYVSGKLGIGIPASEKLEVQGSARINNRLSIGYPYSTSNENLNISNYNNSNVTKSLNSTISKNTTGDIYGLKSYAYNGSGGTYGIYSEVSGVTGKRWAGYFTGGNVTVINGNLGFGIDNPLGVLHTRRNDDNAWVYFASNAGYTKPKPKVANGLAFTWNLSGSEDESIINYSGGTSSRLDFTSWDGTIFKTEMTLKRGNLGIGTTNPDQMLTVNGKIHAKEIIVDVNILADFVFHPSYKLMPLNEVEQFVKTNSHLPEIPSAAEVTKNGMSMGEMQNKLLQKIEELTLYVIEQQKQINLLKQTQK